MNQFARWALFAGGLSLFVVALLMTVRDAAPPAESRVIGDYDAWPEETLEIAAAIPVQDGGRVKPLTTYAGFTMLRLYGARSMKVRPSENAEEIRVGPLAWMMDALFRPQLSMKMPSFRVDSSDVLRAIGVKAGEKRDRYSYEDLEPGRARLFELAAGYQGTDAKERKPLEKQILSLAENVRSYEQLLGTMVFARAGVTMESLDPTNADAAQRANVSSVMATAPMIREVLQRSETERTPIPGHVQSLLEQILDGANAAKFGMFVFPPAAKDDAEWLSPGNRVWNVMTQSTRDVEGSIADIAALEKLARTSPGEEKLFRAELARFKDRVAERAEDRGEYRSVPLEVDYYSKNWFLYALVWFLIGTVLTIGMWMSGRSTAGKILAWGVGLTTFAGWVYVVIPIVKRCIIMQRPPVGNLYDTIIFIAAAVILLGALIELMTRRRFALGLLPVAGVMLILLARLFEVGEARDHMDPLVAVLRSNFWLTTHVIAITLGYASGLVTALLGIVYVLLRGLRLDRGDAGLRRSLTRAVYGMVCLTLFLSLVGTVLGGIWANDSWGRFWGWDPKENGALMIVLLNLAILHARMGGYLREWGLHLAAIFGAAVVTFSWWHVNMLNTGLHSYGFAEGKNFIWLLYGLVGLLLLFGFTAMVIEKVTAAERKSAAKRAPARVGDGAASR